MPGLNSGSWALSVDTSRSCVCHCCLLLFAAMHAHYYNNACTFLRAHHLWFQQWFVCTSCAHVCLFFCVFCGLLLCVLHPCSGMVCSTSFMSVLLCLPEIKRCFCFLLCHAFMYRSCVVLLVGSFDGFYMYILIAYCAGFASWFKCPLGHASSNNMCVCLFHLHALLFVCCSCCPIVSVCGYIAHMLRLVHVSRLFIFCFCMFTGRVLPSKGGIGL